MTSHEPTASTRVDTFMDGGRHRMDRPDDRARSGAIWTVLLVCIALFMLMLDLTIVTTALPEIQASLDASLADLQWVVDAYTLPIACLLLTSATLGDRLGRRKLFLVGMAAFTIASLVTALSPNTLWLNIFRAVQGCGAVLLFGVSLPLVAAAFPEPHARSRAIGAVGAVMATATVLGPMIGGALVGSFGWRWIFLINVPIGLVAVAIAARVIGESKDQSTETPDWLGTVLLTTGLFAGVLALVQGNSWRWTSPRVVTLGIVAVLALLAFVGWEWKCAHPLLDLRLLTRPAFTALLISGLASGAGLIAATTFMAMYFMNTLGYSPFDAGVRVLPLSAASLIAAPLAAITYHRISLQWSVPFALGGIASGLWLCRDIDPADDWVHFAPGLAIAGAGLGILSAVASQGALASVPSHRSGMATGTVNGSRQIGIAVGVAGLGALMHSSTVTRAEMLLDEQQHLAFAMGPERTQALSEALGSGAGLHVLDFVPEQFVFVKPVLTQIATAASAYGLENILTVTAVGTLTATVLTAVLLHLDSDTSTASNSPCADSPPGDISR